MKQMQHGMSQHPHPLHLFLCPSQLSLSLSLEHIDYTETSANLLVLLPMTSNCAVI